MLDFVTIRKEFADNVQDTQRIDQIVEKLKHALTENPQAEIPLNTFTDLILTEDIDALVPGLRYKLFWSMFGNDAVADFLLKQPRSNKIYKMYKRSYEDILLMDDQITFSDEFTSKLHSALGVLNPQYTSEQWSDKTLGARFQIASDQFKKFHAIYDSKKKYQLPVLPVRPLYYDMSEKRKKGLAAFSRLDNKIYIKVYHKDVDGKSITDYRLDNKGDSADGMLSVPVLASPGSLSESLKHEVGHFALENAMRFYKFDPKAAKSLFGFTDQDAALFRISRIFGDGYESAHDLEYLLDPQEKFCNAAQIITNAPPVKPTKPFWKRWFD